MCSASSVSREQPTILGRMIMLVPDHGVNRGRPIPWSAGGVDPFPSTGSSASKTLVAGEPVPRDAVSGRPCRAGVISEAERSHAPQACCAQDCPAQPSPVAAFAIRAFGALPLRFPDARDHWAAGRPGSVLAQDMRICNSKPETKSFEQLWNIYCHAKCQECSGEGDGWGRASIREPWNGGRRGSGIGTPVGIRFGATSRQDRERAWRQRRCGAAREQVAAQIAANGAATIDPVHCLNCRR